MEHLDPMNALDFNLLDVNQEDLQVLKSVFSNVCIDLTLYMQLFGEDESCNELNEFNSFVFPLIQKAYLERICIKVATLMDPAASNWGKQKNLSLCQFIAQTESELLKGKFETLKKFYIDSGIKDWRNKVLAHSDLLTVSDKEPLKVSFTLDQVNDFIEGIQSFIDMMSDPRLATDISVVLPYDRSGVAFVAKIKQCNMRNKTK
ncbi:hypothetical protein DFP76_104238 [Marinomonas aquiplantarum]|uniref:HEPN AbiU2-like domain-containing protein n=2 Tax=Marinomonas aquiplantarum TaxID=491951 RepID=A0A366D1P4_9GAMM|nr:hypothetical protein DFP76_104238 [Marinomonas aquiplantarum]